jgi:hypothetical protein
LAQVLSLMTSRILMPWPAKNSAARAKNPAVVVRPLLVGVDLGIGQPGVVINRGVDVVEPEDLTGHHAKILTHRRHPGSAASVAPQVPFDGRLGA